MDTLYKDNEKYQVRVIDLLSPEVNVFTCGINGDVRTYPTKKTITLTGKQINMLMNCSIPENVTENKDGLNVIVGRTETPRFAINVVGYGEMPTAKATILNGGSNADDKKKIYVAGTAGLEETVNDEPTAEVGTELDNLSMSEIRDKAKKLGIPVTFNSTKKGLISSILEAEEALKIANIEA